MDAKANVDAKSDAGNTPLHIAASDGHYACVQVWTLCFQFHHPLSLHDRSSLLPALNLTS